MSQQKPQRLSEQEYQAWWPFERLDPQRFPLPPKPPTYPTEEEALL